MTKVNNIQQRKSTEYAVKSMADSVIVKDVDLTKRVVTGLYNSFNFFDSDYDVILPGASQKSINERGPNSTAVCKIKHLLHHDWTMLPGKIQVLEERTVRIGNKSVMGIYFETLMANTQMGDDTLINYQENIFDNHSIGFRFLDGDWIDSEAEGWDAMLGKLMNPEAAEEAGFAYLWKEIKLYEGSTVAFGANEMTPYLGVKDANNKQALALKVAGRLQKLQEQLTKGTQSDDMMESFEMQILQLKQIINELFLKGPSTKPTPTKGRETKDTDTEMIHCEACGDFDAQNMQANDDGAYACPNCNALCMPGSKALPMEFLKTVKFI